METEAKDEDGKPLYSFTINNDGTIVQTKGPKAVTAAEPTIEVLPSPSDAPMGVPVINGRETPVEPLIKRAETTGLPNEEELAAQRDIAFKVVFFFVGFIFVCFGLLYVYHRIHQAAAAPSQQKQTL